METNDDGLGFSGSELRDDPRGAWLELRAIQADERSTATIALGSVWEELTAGRLQIALSFATAERCYLVVHQALSRQATPVELTPRKVRMFERILLEASQKSVAVDLGLSASTIALISKHCLEAMGLACPPWRLPLLLVIAVHAARERGMLCEARSAKLVDGELGYQVLSVPRPDAAWFAELPAAERSVGRLLVEGRTYAEIAHERRTSVRTVANQITAIFRRIGVSGRLELLRWLCTTDLPPEGAALHRRPPLARARALAELPMPAFEVMPAGPPAMYAKRLAALTGSSQRA